MTILNIGGAGFIGSVATETFIENKHKVIVLDDLSTGFKFLVHPKAKFYQGSMTNYALLDKIFKKHKIDVVTLYAAKIVVPESVNKPIDYFLTNVGGLAVVLKAMVNNNVKKIVFASSAAVYGPNHTKPINEDDLKQPCNPYGQTKLICEQLLEDTKIAHGVNYIALRFFNVAGASKTGKYGMAKPKPTLLIPAINDNILNNKEIKIFGRNYKTRDKTCLRDYVHVQDLANAALLSIKYLTDKKQSNYFNLGSGKGHTVLEIVKKCQKLIGKKKFKYSFYPRRSGDPDFLLTNNSKAKKLLHWTPQYKIDDMILSDWKFRQKIYDCK